MAATNEEAVRQAIIGACLAMNHNGINQGTAGNISVRWNGGLLITPSGLPYEEMATSDIVFMKMDGSYEHKLAASSEWRFHRDILQARGDINAVVHAHPIHATAFAICGMEIPAVHYMIAAAGGPTIRCAPYAPYGTEELSNAVLEALSGRRCALLGNHGMVATGPDLREAMWLAIEVETLCKQYAVALQVGTPHVLEADEIEKTTEKFKDYGPRRKPRAAQVFDLRQICEARGKAGGQREEPSAMRNATPDRANVIASPTLIFAGFLVLGFGLEMIWPAAFLPEGWSLSLGLIAIFAALNIKLFAAREMVRAKTNLNIRKPANDIVTAGPYGVSRNPLYIGMILLNIGIGCFVNSLWIFLLSAGLAATLQKCVIEPEEAYLEQKFGDKYLRYKAKVRRWV